MLLSPLQPKYKVRINVRPIKYAYFVREDDVETFNRIVRLICTQWGGIRSLIIPVQSDFGIKPLFERLLKLHEPDRFVHYMASPLEVRSDEVKGFERHLQSRWPLRTIQLITGGQLFELDDSTAHAVNMLHNEDVGKHGLLVHVIANSEPDQQCLLTLFGEIYRGQEKYYSEHFALRSEQVQIGTDQFWESQHNNSHFGSVLNLTDYGVSPYRATNSFASNEFDIILTHSVNSICMFWNFRATRDAAQFDRGMGRRTMLLPIALLSDRSALQSMVDFVRSRIPYPNVSTNLHIRFCVWDESDRERLERAIQGIDGLERLQDEKISGTHSWSRDEPNKIEDLTGKPITYLIYLPDVPDSYHEGFNPSYNIAVNTEMGEGANEVFFTPPPRFQNRHGGAISFDLECEVWQRYPLLPSISEQIKAGSWFSRYGLSFVGSASDRPTYIQANLPTEWATLNSFFQMNGYDIRLSRPGSYGTALANLIGGLQQVSLLASKPAYLLLDTLALKSTDKLTQKIVRALNLEAEQSSTIRDVIQRLVENIEIVPEMKRIPKTYRELKDGRLKDYKNELIRLLAQLSEKRVIMRGFHLECPNCHTPSWHPLRFIEEVVVCPGCSHEFPLPVESSPGSEIQWEYTLNTLVNRAMDQDVLPAVLALYYLTKERQYCCAVPGLEIVQSNQVKAEFDFVFVSNHEVSAGECKAGTEIGEKDIETAKLAANLGVHHFYYCTVRQFSEATQQSVETLKNDLAANKSSMSVDVLNGSNLLGEAIT